MAAGAVLTVGPVLEEQVHRDGLLALQRIIGEADLLDFPKRANGTQVLLRQSFFEKLLAGQLELLSFPPADVIAAQADVRNLSLSQLLHIRCSHLDFNAGPSVRTQGEFLSTVEGFLESRIAARLATEGGPVLPPNGQAGELVRLVLLIYGAVQHMSEEGAATQRWLVRCGATEGALVLQDCCLGTLEDGEPTYCHRSLSRASAAVPRAKRQLHWEVEIRENPKEFASNSPGRKDSERRPRLSGQRLQNRRSGESAEDTPSAASQSQDPESPSKAHEFCVDLASKLDAEAAEETARLRAELSDAKGAAAEATAEAEALRVELKAAKEAAAKAAADAKGPQDVASAMQRAEALRAELTGAQEATAKAVSEAEALRAQLAELKAATVEREVPEAAKEPEKSSEAEAAEKECVEAKEAAEKARGEAKEATEKVQALQAELDAATSSAEGLRAELDAAKAATSKAEAELDAAKEAVSKAQALNAELEAAKETAGKAETLSAELEASKEAASKVEALSTELAAAKEAASEAEGLRLELSALKEAKSGSEELRAELDAAKEAMRKAGEEAAKLRDELNTAQQKAEEQSSAVNAAEKAQAEATAKATTLKEQLAKSKAAEASWKAKAEQWRAKANAAAEKSRATLEFGDAVDLCGAPEADAEGPEFADAEEDSGEKLAADEEKDAANDRPGFFGRMFGRFGGGERGGR